MRPIILSVAGVCAIFTPSMASTLTGANLLAESTVSSVWLTNEYCEIRGCSAKAVVERGFDVALPYAPGRRSLKSARPAVHAAACPPQWLPVFLAVSETDAPPPLLAPPPPMLPPPSPPSPSPSP
eukprot:scaffold134867_cov63-Phaeocystis_antarctica.AAC.2